MAVNWGLRHRLDGVVNSEDRPMSLISELKRRNVLRVAIAYLAAAWLLTEVAGTLFPMFGFGDTPARVTVIVLAIGFPLFLIFSWAFEITPEGLRFEKDVDRTATAPAAGTRPLDRAIIVLLALALGYLAFDKFVLDPARDARLVEQAAQQARSKALVESDVEQSVAVLPFANISANPDDAYLVDGIHDDLLAHISRIGAIKSISRTSVLRYRDSAKSIPEIAEELGVATILEGGVQRAGEQVRINVQLIDAQTDKPLWAEIYDRQLSASNIFAIQSEIADSIAQALRATLSPQEKQRTNVRPTENFSAYEAYLIGKQRLASFTTASLAEAGDYFSRALALDPGFALAWVGLSNTYQLQVYYSGLPAERLIQQANDALQKALEIDEGLAEAHESLGRLELMANDFMRAEQSFSRALELNPNLASAHHWNSQLLNSLGRKEEALHSAAKAVELDPMSPIIRDNYANFLRQSGRFDEAWEQFEIIQEIEPDFPDSIDGIATIQHQVFNRYDEGASGFVKVIALDPERPPSYVWLGQLFLDLQAGARAARLFQRAAELAPTDLRTQWGELLLHQYLGELDEAVEPAKNILADWRWPEWITQFCAAVIRNQALAENRESGALAVYAERYPELLTEDEPQLGLANYRAAIDLALVLQRAGEANEADRLLDSASAFVDTLPRLGWWSGHWVSDVQILALKGRNQEALGVLEQAVDEGWRSLWWYYLLRDPNLDSIRDETEFQRIVALVEADMSAQMQRVREMEESGEIPAVPGVNFGQE